MQNVLHSCAFLCIPGVEEAETPGKLLIPGMQRDLSPRLRNPPKKRQVFCAEDKP